MRISSLDEAARVIESRAPISGVSFDWNGILDSLKASCGFREEKELADYLGIKPLQLSEFRCGRTKLVWLAKVKALDALGFHKTAEAFQLLFAEEQAEKLERARRRAAKRRAATGDSAPLSPGSGD